MQQLNIHLRFDLSPFTVHVTLFFCLCAEADLRIGELQWGDSGVYFCKVIIADDLEGRNEGQVELLVLGMSALNLSTKAMSSTR